MLKAADCNDYSFLTYDADESTCTTNCDPNAAGSLCPTWTYNYDRVKITTTSVLTLQKFRLERVVKNIPSGTCYYYRIYAAPDTGCLSTRPYWMTFVNNQ
jgi:hypothetical protein